MERAARSLQEIEVLRPAQNLLRYQFFIGIRLNDLVVQAVKGKFKAVADAQLVIDLT
jgi:hypothetical protein